MKKELAVILLVASLSTFVACGTGNNESDNITTDKQSVLETVADTESNTDSSASVGTSEDTTSEAVDSNPAFDTSWADNSFEALLPELPFVGWTVKQENDKIYKMELSGLNTSPATNPYNSGEPDGADKTKLLEYIKSLSSFGFVTEETGAGYMWVATDKVGNKIEFKCGDGYCGITITKK